MKQESSQIDLNDLAYVTNILGEIVLSSKPCPTDQRTKKINPHVSQFRVLGKPNQIVSLFHIKPVYYEHIDSTDECSVFRPLYEVCEYYGNHRIVIKYEHLNDIHPRFLAWLIKRQALLNNGQVLITSPYEKEIQYPLTDQLGVPGTALISFTVTTVYPDPSPETTTFDGGISNIFGSSGTSLSAMESTTTTTNTNDSAVKLQDNDWGYAVGYIKAPSGQHYPLRTAVLFDTSAIGDSDTIDDVTLSLYGGGASSDGMNDTYGYVGVGQLTTGSNTGWSAADITFSNWGTTQYATGIDITSWSTAAYNVFTFNSTGKSAINKTGVTKIGLMHGREYENQNWTGGSANSYVQAYAADQTGTSNDPKLAVTHTVSSKRWIGMFVLTEKA